MITIYVYDKYIEDKLCCWELQSELLFSYGLNRVSTHLYVNRVMT